MTTYTKLEVAHIEHMGGIQPYRIVTMSDRSMQVWFEDGSRKKVMDRDAAIIFARQHICGVEYLE